MPGIALRTGPSDCSTAPRGTPSPRWEWCAGSRWPGLTRRAARPARGGAAPGGPQGLLNRAAWDTFAAMGVVRRFAVAGLDEAARRPGRRGALRIGALDETGQEKKGQ